MARIASGLVSPGGFTWPRSRSALVSQSTHKKWRPDKKKKEIFNEKITQPGKKENEKKKGAKKKTEKKLIKKKITAEIKKKIQKILDKRREGNNFFWFFGYLRSFLRGWGGSYSPLPFRGPPLLVRRLAHQS